MNKYTAEQVSDWLRQRAVGRYIHRTDAELNLMADAIDVLLREREAESARVPESEWITELRGKLLLSKATHVFSFTRNEVTELLGGLAAAPKPETEE